MSVTTLVKTNGFECQTWKDYRDPSKISEIQNSCDCQDRWPMAEQFWNQNFTWSTWQDLINALRLYQHIKTFINISRLYQHIKAFINKPKLTEADSWPSIGPDASRLLRPPCLALPQSYNIHFIQTLTSLTPQCIVVKIHFYGGENLLYKNKACLSRFDNLGTCLD
jgi:hypothetical protein